MKCRLSWPQNRPLGTFGGPLPWRVARRKPPFTMEEFTFTSLLSNLSDFDLFFDFFIVFHIVFHQLLLPFWSLHFFLFFVVCELFRIWLNTNVHRVFTMPYQQSLCRFAPGGSPKHPPRQPTGATRFSKHALTNRWMAQFPGAEGQEPKKGEGSWWKGGYT